MEFSPPIIQTPPSGWLGLLGLKSGGKQPEQSAKFLQPIQEMTSFYLSGARQSLGLVAASVAAQNANSSIELRVPPGKVWLLESAIFVSTAIGAVAPQAGFITIADASNQLFAFGPASQAGVTGTFLVGGYTPPIGYLVMLPGWQIRVWTASAAAPTAFNYSIRAFGSEVSA